MHKVIFYREPSEQMIFAYFPEVVWSEGYFTSYSKIGQHSACSPQYVADLEEATVEEYTSLQDELVSIGYTLIVLNRD
jgi:hypothetical protein